MRPMWFRVAAAVLLLWGLMGCWACVQQIRLGADAMPGASDYDRALMAGLPGWYNAVYAIAVGAGTLAAAALLAGSRVAVALAIVSVVALVVQFGWLFATTDILAVKGAWTAYFPAFILAVALAQAWLAMTARTRGWLR